MNDRKLQASVVRSRRRRAVSQRLLALCGLLVCLVVGAWQSDSCAETVPRTFDGAGEAFKEGGRDLGRGFRGLGRGIGDTFTGKPAREDYRDSRNIGTGFKNFGLGIAGGGRAVGRGFKRAFTGSAD